MTLISRTAKIIENGTDPSSILLLTFTNKAADEMKSRGIALLDDRFEKVTACTYHSFCNELLRKYYRSHNHVVIDRTTAADTVKLLMSRIPGTEARDFPRAETIVSILSTAINQDVTIDEAVLTGYEKYDHHISLIDLVCEEYKKYKTEHNQLDYDDLLVKTAELLEKYPPIRVKVSEKYQYIMVDEYQDSNALQLKILKLLCMEKKVPNICAVGDDQQSIYLFRGADFENILNFQYDFKGCELIILDKNYRSNQEILDVANEVIHDAPEKFDKDLKGTRTKGDKPTLALTYDTMDSANYVKNMIDDYVKKGIPLNEIAVLSRGSRATSSLEAILNLASIPFKKYGGASFNDRRFVKDITALFKICINLLDEVSWFRWLQLYPGIGPKKAFSIIEKIKDRKDINVLRDATPHAEGMIDLYNKLGEVSFIELFDIGTNYYFYLRNELIEKMKKDKRTKKEGIMRELSLLKDDKNDAASVLRPLAEKYSAPQEFVDDMVLFNTNNDQDDNSLVISTVHSAKGLEFKVTFLFDCVEGSFPFTMSEGEHSNDLAQIYAEKEMEEERRILYVALTRAKDDLYVICPITMIVFGIREETALNRYLCSAYLKNLLNVHSEGPTEVPLPAFIDEEEFS